MGCVTSQQKCEDEATPQRKTTKSALNILLGRIKSFRSEGKTPKSKKGDLPLLGVRVVDFGQYIAGPLVAKMLVDQGADVVHIDPITGPCWNCPANEMLNDNKACIKLDLTKADDRARAKQLIDMADIMIENFPPGKRECFQLGPDEVKRGHHSLIYVSLPGFASTDDENQAYEAHEAVILALGGAFCRSSRSSTSMSAGSDLSYSPLPLASVYAGVIAGALVTAALHARYESGEGDVIEIPLVSALVSILDLGTSREHIAKWDESLHDAKKDSISNSAKSQTGKDVVASYPFNMTYMCCDKRPFFLAASRHDAYVNRTLDLLGCREEVANICSLKYLVSEKYSGSQSPRLQDLEASKIIAILAECFAKKTSLDWECDFERARVPCSAIRTTREWLYSKHAIESGLVVERTTPQGEMIMLGPLTWLSGSARKVGSRRVTLSDFMRERQTCSTICDSTPHGSAKGRGYLDGVRILDLSNVFATSLVGQLCSRFGADYIRYRLDAGVVSAEIGHRGLAEDCHVVDVDTPAGKAALRGLVFSADVVLYDEEHLVSQGADIREMLNTMNPSAILYHLSSLGGPLGGPRSSAVGSDCEAIAQAATGVTSRFCGSAQAATDQLPPYSLPVLASFAGVFGLCLSLFHRNRSDSAEVVETSMASVAQLQQLQYCFDLWPRQSLTEPKGTCLGEHALYRAYKCKDGLWGFLAAVGQHPHPDRVFEAELRLGVAFLPNTEAGLESFCAENNFSDVKAAFDKISITFVAIEAFAKSRKNPSFECRQLCIRSVEDICCERATIFI